MYSATCPRVAAPPRPFTPGRARQSLEAVNAPRRPGAAVSFRPASRRRAHSPWRPSPQQPAAAAWQPFTARQKRLFVIQPARTQRIAPSRSPLPLACSSFPFNTREAPGPLAAHRAAQSLRSVHPGDALLSPLLLSCQQRPSAARRRLRPVWTRRASLWSCPLHHRVRDRRGRGKVPHCARRLDVAASWPSPPPRANRRRQARYISHQGRHVWLSPVFQ